MSSSIREITKSVAAAVISEAIEEDLAEGYREMDARELRKLNKVFLKFKKLYILTYIYFIKIVFLSLSKVNKIIILKLFCYLQDELLCYVENSMWNPDYPTLIYKKD